MANLSIYVPYSDFAQLEQDASKLASIIAILTTEFPDDTCQLIAIKSVLGIEEVESDPTDPTDPSDPTTP